MGPWASWSLEQTSSRIPSGLGWELPLQSVQRGAFLGFSLVWFSCPHLSALTHSLFHVWPAPFSCSDLWMCPCCHDYQPLVLTQPGFWSQLLHSHTVGCSVPSFGFSCNLICTLASGLSFNHNLLGFTQWNLRSRTKVPKMCLKEKTSARLFDVI